jgi:transposase-like protein
MPQSTEYSPDFPARALDLMRGGASLREVAAELDIPFHTLQAWRTYDRRQELADALDEGVALAQAWWEKLGRAGAAGKVDINATIWLATMRNRFGWTKD